MNCYHYYNSFNELLPYYNSFNELLPYYNSFNELCKRVKLLKLLPNWELIIKSDELLTLNKVMPIFIIPEYEILSIHCYHSLLNVLHGRYQVIILYIWNIINPSIISLYRT